MSKEPTSTSETPQSTKIRGAAADDPLDKDPQLALLAEAVSELPASVQPERDLWQEVVPRLRPRQRPVHRPRWRRGLPRLSRHPGWRQALAAGFGLVAGSALTYFSMSGPESAVSPPMGAELRLASSGSPMERAEMQFLRAKEELWIAVFEQRQQMSPEAWEMVEQNLQILDSAVADLRTALLDDPGNPALERRILTHQRRSLELLREVASGLSDSV
ncbi:MAG: hypothetical protein MPN21_08455 [Thermoanaerobaculia bacterium]|nr:hypothetical protein [Thermoanaerobaculia bacterium]